MRKKNLSNTSFVTFLFLMTFSCASGCATKTNENGTSLSTVRQANLTPQECFEIIVDYVRTTRGWRNEDYAVRYYGPGTDGLIELGVFWIGPGKLGPEYVGGDGKSFSAYINTRTRQVEKALLSE